MAEAIETIEDVQTAVRGVIEKCQALGVPLFVALGDVEDSRKLVFWGALPEEGKNGIPAIWYALGIIANNAADPPRIMEQLQSLYDAAVRARIKAEGEASDFDEAEPKETIQ